MGGKSSAPAPPDYSALLPQQEAAYNRGFQNMLGASRINSVTPYGRTTWTPPPGFYGQGGGGGTTTQPGTATAQGGPGISAAQGGPGMDQPPPAYGTRGDMDFSAPTPIGTAVNTLRNLPGGPVGQNEMGGNNGFGGPWTVTQELSPDQQAILDSNERLQIGRGQVAEGMLGNVANQYQDPRTFAQDLMPFQQFDPAQYQQGQYQNYGPYQQQDWRGPQYNTNVNSRDDAERAYYNREMAYLNPELEQQENRMSDRLLAMGANVADPTYQNGMGEVYDAAAKARSAARNNAIVMGGNEATQELQRGLMTEDPRFRAAQSEGQFGYNAGANENRYGQQFNQGERQFGYNAAQQGQQFRANENQRGFGQSQARVQQSIADYLMPMNLQNAFMQGNQVQLPGMPAQFNTPNLQTADPMAAAQNTYAGQLGQYNANQAGSNNFMNGLFGLGSAWLSGGGGNPFSDARLKTNITPIGQTPGGTNLYLWDWKDGSGPSVGVIAQEVPEAVVVDESGYLRVDYSKVQ